MSYLLHLPVRQWFWIAIFLLIGTYSFGQTYCTPKYNFVECNTLQRRLYIYNVLLNNRQFSTGCSQAGYAGVVNLTSNGTTDPVVLTSGVSYTMTVNTYDYDSKTYSAINNQSYFSVWIDYDNNGAFENSERIRDGNSSNFSITIRNNAAGAYRMRIRTQTSDPCAVSDYGETEDYALKIVPPVPRISGYGSDYYCLNSNIALAASGCEGGIIRWYEANNKGFLGNNPALVKLTQGYNNNGQSIFYATCAINGIEGSPEYKSLNVWLPGSPAISSNNYNLTVGQTATLTATGCMGGTSGSGITWSNGALGSQITVSPTQTTRYTATCNIGRAFFLTCTSNPSNEITITVNAPSAPSLSVSKNVICPTESVVLSASNCTGTVKWSTGVTGVSSITVSPTQKTDYAVSCVINNVEGAKATTSISVNQPTAITKQPTSIAICEGSQGVLGVEAPSNGNFSYVWTRSGQSLPDSSATTSQLVLRNVTIANNGIYQVRVTGVCGTVSSSTATVQVSSKMTAFVSATAVNCSGDGNGSVTATINGGLGGKQYRLANQGADYQASPTFTNLRSGPYTIQVRDLAGCTAEASATVTQPERITFGLRAPTNAKCASGNDGSIEVKAEGGNGSYLYSVNGGTPQANGLFQNLKANETYVIRVTDAKSCSETTGAYVGAPNQIVVSLTPIPVKCAGGTTGQISTVASGGTGSDYKFQLDQGQAQSSNTFSGLKPASYTVTVKDANGCEGKADVIVTQPTPVTVTATATLVSCINDTSAAITAAASGGTGLFQYQLNTRPFQSTTLFGNIREGSYIITAKDANECTAITTVTVRKADPLLLQTTPQPASCCTCPDGAVSLTSSGGIGPKQYQFGQQALQPGNSFRGIAPGRYTVTVRDETGCPTSQTITIANANPVTVTLASLKNTNCAGGRDGAATAQVTGGKRPFTYAWQTKNPSDSLGTGASVTRLPEGEFTVTVTDSNRCAVPASGTLTALNPLPPKPTISTSGGSLVSSAQSGIQWYRGTDLKTGRPVANATQATFTPFESNSFFVAVTVNGCVSSSDVFNFILTALEPSLPLVLRVLPNPVNGQLRIEVEQPNRAELHVRLTDLTGRTILDVETPAFSGKRQFTWPLPNAGTGTYLLQADAGLHRSMQRVVVH